MIDFHTHILPGIDDGSSSLEESLEMLRLSAEQGVDLLYLTPHFYAEEDSPASFLKRREEAFGRLSEWQEDDSLELRLGAEVLYYQGMEDSAELEGLAMEKTRLILIEPPFTPWPNYVISEIRRTGENLGLVPVIAHADRYMRMFNDKSIVNSLLEERLLVQFNTKAFLDRSFAPLAFEFLKKGKIAFIGTDAHNTGSRPVNLGEACAAIRNAGLARELAAMNERSYRLLNA